MKKIVINSLLIGLIVSVFGTAIIGYWNRHQNMIEVLLLICAVAGLIAGTLAALVYQLVQLKWGKRKAVLLASACLAIAISLTLWGM